jgi:hypothetical protein
MAKASSVRSAAIGVLHAIWAHPQGARLGAGGNRRASWRGVFVVFKRLHALRHLLCALTRDRDREKVCPLIGRDRAVAITLDMVQWRRLRRRLWLLRPSRWLDHPGQAVKPGVMRSVGYAV